MNWSSLGRIFKLGFVNFWRNSWLSIASTLIMTLTLLIISIFVVLTLAIGKTTEMIKAKMDITAYFQDSATTQEISDFQQKVAARGDVKEVRYVSKEEALQVWNETQKNARLKEVAQSLEENPFPRSLEIKAVDPTNLESIDGFISSDDYKKIIHYISYQDNKNIIDRLISFTLFTKEAGWLFSSLFILISIIVIFNTIRLAIFTRKEEVEIMRLVGASNNFIRMPFMVEGFMYGFIACLLAFALVWIGFLSISPLVVKNLGAEAAISLKIFFLSYTLIVFLIQFLVGTVVGVGASLFSIRKYLKI